MRDSIKPKAKRSLFGNGLLLRNRHFSTSGNTGCWDKSIKMSSEATVGQVADVYGQVHPAETPELIQTKLAEFDNAVAELLARNQEKDSTSLCRAIEKCPDQLTNDFKLKFLRCEVFNVDLAVERYASYWEKHEELAGPDITPFQPLTLKTLSADHSALELGFMQMVPGVADPRGRAILYMDPSVLDRRKYTPRSLARAAAYMAHAALESETAQKHGVVIIYNASAVKLSQLDRRVGKILLPCLQKAIPMRLSAVHICRPPLFFDVVLPILKLFMSDRMRKRILFHSGSTEKVLNHLKEKFELEKNVLPEAIGGDVKLDHSAWLEDRRSKSL